jgi:hypothetical protein
MNIASKHDMIGLTRQLTFDDYAQGAGERHRVGSEPASTAIPAKPDAPLTQLLSSDANSGLNSGRHSRRLSLLWRHHNEADVSESPPALMPIAYPNRCHPSIRMIPTRARIPAGSAELGRRDSPSVGV